MPTQTTRSVIKFGDSSLVVSLPKGWTDYYQVRPGDRVLVVANDVLIIHPPGAQQDDREDSAG